jgi:transposase-like protein
MPKTAQQSPPKFPSLTQPLPVRQKGEVLNQPVLVFVHNLKEREYLYHSCTYAVVTQMPLINCPDCGNEISDEAYVCPKCGRPTGKRPKYPLKRLALLWLALIAVFLAIWTFLPPK